jgi:hypothetical protein
MFGNSVSRPFPSQIVDVTGRLKMSRHQNIYDADFEYGAQPLRWESFTAGSGSILHQPGQGGVRMNVSGVSGDLAIRQSRPYHRYQPGKTMYMASACLFGTPNSNNRQRVGYFDDSNGVFFEQGDITGPNPSGMSVVVRSDVGGTPVDTRVSLEAWNGDSSVIQKLDWTRIQMLFIEYAWYGAGALRWGVFINGDPVILHQIGVGNRTGQTLPWARTGNLPVRYELRNVGTTAGNNAFIHYGVSVMVEGGVDDQRGFTYAYGMAPATPRRTVATNSTRYPVLSIRNRIMGTIEYTQASSAITAGTTTSLTATGTPWTVDQWKGRGISYVNGGVTYTARITSNTASVLTIADSITGGVAPAAPVAGQNYIIGLINRGQILPRQLLVSSSAIAVVEIIASTTASPVTLTGSSFTALATLGSTNSFAERDVSSTALTGGEVVMAFTAPAGGSGLQQLDLSNLFPLYTNIRGNVPDILTLAITTTGTASDVGAHFICQEAMS